MIIYIIYIFSFFTCIFPNIVKQINIAGNSKTSDHYILKNINHEINIPYNQEIANNDIEALLHMGIFESVQIIMNDNIYNILVKEKSLITYEPLIRKEDGIGWSVGPIIHINNINGNAKNIYFSSGIGDIKSGEIRYFNQKLLLEYKYNTYNSIESDYTINKNNLFISYIIKNRKYTVNVTPQINNYILNYMDSNNRDKYQYFSLSYDLLYTISKSSKYRFNLTHNYSMNNQINYSKLIINYKHMIDNNSRLISFNTKIILNTKQNSPDFENLYIGGENYIRGYYPNPSENDNITQNKLMFKNLVLQSIQYEIPMNFIKNKIVKTNLLLFYDYGIGSNKYNQFKNKALRGYGFGISMKTINNMKFNICIGFNPFGSQTIHFIREFN